MPPFVYQQYSSPFANTIAQLLAHQNDPYAEAAQTIAAANARAGELSANAWGGAVQNIASAATKVGEEYARQQEIAPKLAQEKLNLATAQHLAAGKTALATLEQGDQLPLGDVGPRQPTYMTEDGHWDIPALSARLGQIGYGDIAPDLVQHTENLNKMLDDAQTAQEAAATKRAVYLGGLANTALTMTQKVPALPLDGTLKFLGQQGVTGKQITDQQLNAALAPMAGMSPEEQQLYVQGFVDRADRAQKPIDVKEGDTLIGATSGKPLYIGAEKKDENWMARDAATLGTPNETPTAKNSALAMGIRHPKPPAPKLTPAELDENAFARAIGKTDSSELDDAERQAFNKRKAQQAAQVTGAQQLQTHIAEQAWDRAHPPAPDQTKLERDYRTVLLRAVSSRSGTLGREDVRVADANHMLQAFNQYYDPQTDTWNIPSVPLKELALGTAKLMAGGGNVGVEAMKSFEQASLKGDIAQAVGYLSGTTPAAAPQAVAKMLHDLVQRQGDTAVSNRNQSIEYLHMIAPTELEEKRRDQLDAAELTHLHRTARVRLPDGRFILRTSDDGGKTWQP